MGKTFDELVADLAAAWEHRDPDDEVLSRLEAGLIAAPACGDDEREALRLAVLVSKAEVAGLADEVLQPMRKTTRYLAGSLAFGRYAALARRYVG